MGLALFKALPSGPESPLEQALGSSVRSMTYSGRVSRSAGGTKTQLSLDE
jgi:hypothetical protein